MKILLVDEQKILLQGIRSLLEKQAEIQAVSDAYDGRSAIDLAMKLLPDIVVTGIFLPDISGIEVVRRIMSQMPGGRILALSASSSEQLVIEILEAGAKGYVLKNSPFEELIGALRAIMRGQIYLCNSVMTSVIKDFVQGLSKVPLSIFKILAPRERYVLQLLSEGHSTKEISSVLGLSIKTIETYRQQIMAKLDIRTIPGLTKYAIRTGLTTLD